jgi:hypothetical protein
MQKNPLDDIVIREADLSDVSSIVNAFSDYLEEIKDNPEQELTFSNYNVRLFRMMLIESISNHDICPVIALIGSKKIGFNFWIKISSFELKEEIVHALGTFIREDYRGLGLVNILANRSFEYLKSKGVKKVYGKVFKNRTSSSKLVNSLELERIEILCKTL